jgi:hypothetical protein
MGANQNEAGLAATLAREADPDRLITFRQAAEVWPGRGPERPLDLSAVYRHAERGASGQRLRHVVVPGTGRCTTLRWILQYVEEVDRARRGRESAGHRTSTNAVPR